MMSIYLYILFLVTILPSCEPRSISLVVRHQQFFEVQDTERDFIELHEDYEKVFQLQNHKKAPDKQIPKFTKESTGAAEVGPSHIGPTLNDVTPANDVTDGDVDIERGVEDMSNDNADHYDTSDDNDDDNDDLNEDDATFGGYGVSDGHDNEIILSNDDVLNDNYDIESTSGLKRLFRKKRFANEQWKNSLPGGNPSQTTVEDSLPDVWEEVTDKDLRKAQMSKYKQIAEYAGWTLLSVVFFVFVGICFLRDPIACIFAFGTGCPCCLVCCPCIRSFTDKYLDTKRLVREQMNKYMPGIIVNDDGSLDYYKPSADELDILVEIIDELAAFGASVNTISPKTSKCFLGVSDGHDNEIILSNDDVLNDNYDIESASGLKRLFRKKRFANEQWKNSLPGGKPSQTTVEDSLPDVWEEVTDKDLRKAQMSKYKQIAEYAGWTLLSVVFFVFVGICFLRDPIACIFAFGTGCPCCLVCCPCIRSFTDKYLDTKRLVREQMNKYMPGIIVNDDGSLDYYKPSADELDILVEIIDELAG